MGYSHIIIERLDGIVKITLNRPEVLNALNTPLLTELKSALREVQTDPEADVVILTGAGRAFSAGMDLKALGRRPAPGEPDPLLLAVEVMDALQELDRPVIAAVNGYAITGGMELALACDIILASEKAILGDTHARVGIMPGGGNSQKLPRLVGAMKAKEILFASKFLSAQEALSLGLVNAVVPEEELENAALDLARRIRENDRNVVRRLKKLINQGMRLDLDKALMLERIEFMQCVQTRSPEELEARRGTILEKGRSQKSIGNP